MSQPTDLHRRLAAAIERVSTALRQGVQGAASEEGLSPLQLRALQILSRRPGLRLGQLARELHVTPGTLSAAVTTLESKGLARKESDPSEHRAVHLHDRRGCKHSFVKRSCKVYTCILFFRSLPSTNFPLRPARIPIGSPSYFVIRKWGVGLDCNGQRIGRQG